MTCDFGLFCMQVYLCARSWQNPAWAADTESPFGPRSNIWRRGVPCALHPDGGVTFKGGETASNVDVVIHATGYHYSFPFLSDTRIGGAPIITVDDNRLAGIPCSSCALLSASAFRRGSLECLECCLAPEAAMFARQMSVPSGTYVCACSCCLHACSLW